MLTVDELWLTHAARIRANTSVTLEDILYEDLLFRVEALLVKSQAQLVPLTRERQPARETALRDPAEARARRGIRRWTNARTQPR